VARFPVIKTVESLHISRVMLTRLKRCSMRRARARAHGPLSNIDDVAGVVETVQRPVTPFPQHGLLLRNKGEKNGRTVERGQVS
jgi:hypothetical protein